MRHRAPFNPQVSDKVYAADTDPDLYPLLRDAIAGKLDVSKDDKVSPIELKALLLTKILGHGINNWRWALVYAAAPATLVGYLATYLPEWAELALGVPAILATYGFVIWKRGFGPEDRVLFSKKKKEAEEAVYKEERSHVYKKILHRTTCKITCNYM